MDERLETWFRYHTPDAADIDKYVAIRDSARVTAYIILENTPPSADQTAALRKLRECVMTANAAIACKGK